MTISNDNHSSINNKNEAVQDARPRIGHKKTRKKFDVLRISNHRDEEFLPKNLELDEEEFNFEGADYLLKALSGTSLGMDSSLASNEAFVLSPGAGGRRPKKTLSPRRPRTPKGAAKAKSQFTYPMDKLPL